MGSAIPSSFLDSARTGRNAWWRYVVGLLVVVAFTSLLGAVVVLLALGFLGAAVPGLAGSPLYDYLSLVLVFPFAWLGLLVVIRRLHGRSFRSLVSGSRPVRWGRMGWGALLWLVLLALLTGVDVLTNPGQYSVTFAPAAWLLALPFVLLLTPIQTTAEELVFRGYLLQATGLLTRRLLWLVLPSSLLFSLMHAANPEFLANPLLGWLPYFIIGLLLAVVTVLDDGAELAIGVHAANNIYSFIGVATAGGTAVTAPILTRATLDPLRSTLETLVACVVFGALLILLKRRQAAGQRLGDVGVQRA